MVRDNPVEAKTVRRPRSLLFLCTGNSARSQMAEGFARTMFPPEIKIYSAGITPVGVHPFTIEVMKECDVDIRYHYSKGLSSIPLDQIDTVITLCDYAKTYCPTFPRPVDQHHWSIEDPVRFRGLPDAVKPSFRKARDEIRARIEEYIKLLKVMT